MNARRRATSRVTRRARVTSISTPVGQSAPRERVQARAIAADRGLETPVLIPANRLEMIEAERVAFIARRRRVPVTAEELTALEARLSQRCPDCGRPEAAHFYCSGCYLPMGLADWFRGEASPAKKAAMEASRAKRHPGPDRGSALTKRPTFGVLAGPTESLTLGF